jgi:hypothetical protein
MVLGRGDLNLEFAEGLKTAFEQPDRVFSAYTNLAIEDHKNTKEKRVWTYSRHMVVVRSLIGRQFTTGRLTKRHNTPRLGWIRRVHPYPFSGGQDTLVFLEDVGTPEGQGIVDAASMSNSVIHDDEVLNTHCSVDYTYTRMCTRSGCGP